MKHPGRAGHNLTGLQFGSLTVLQLHGHDPYRRRLWLCRCNCGRKAVRLGCSLVRNGHSASCGCWSRRLAAENVAIYAVPKTITHGMSGRHRHPLYGVWAGMISRCENKNTPNFKYWAGKGVKVCDNWRHDCKSFVAWAIAAGWKPGLQIDRIDPAGDYEPDNCQWLTPAQHSKKTKAEQQLSKLNPGEQSV